MKGIKTIIGLSILGIWAFRKIDKYKAVMQSLVFSIKRIKDVHASFTNPYVDVVLDLLITNPTNQKISLKTRGLVTIKKIEFYNSQTNDLIGSTNAEIRNIELLANNTTTIPGVRARLFLLGGILNNFDFFTSGMADDKLKIVSTIEVFGKQYTVVNQNKLEIGV